MTLGLADPRERYRWWANGKTNVGPCWRSLIQSELSRGSHKSPDRVRDAKIREHNTDMTETKAVRVEQNTRHKAKPSTIYQVYRCIKLNKIYCDIPTSKHVPNKEQHLHVPTRNKL